MVNMQEFYVKGRQISIEKPPYLVAEMACAHQGDPDILMKLLDVAIDAAPDAIQLQVLNIEELVSSKNPAYEDVVNLQIADEVWVKAINKIKDAGLHAWVNVFDQASIDLAVKSGCDALKIHSTDAANPDMLRAAAKAGLPLSLAIGGTTEDEIAWAISFLENNGVKNLLLMAGIQTFPTPLQESHLHQVSHLNKRYKYPVGYQDHLAPDNILTEALPLMAVAAGAVLIEKHFTYDEGLTNIDSASSLPPKRFAHFVQMMRSAELVMGPLKQQKDELSEAEIGYRTRMKKVAVAAHEIKKGQLLKKEDFKFKRIEGDIYPNQIESYLGKQCLETIERDFAILREKIKI